MAFLSHEKPPVMVALANKGDKPAFGAEGLAGTGGPAVAGGGCAKVDDVARFESRSVVFAEEEKEKGVVRAGIGGGVWGFGNGG
eukprot:6577610-Pyramimonas_sp.AAC.1